MFDGHRRLSTAVHRDSRLGNGTNLRPALSARSNGLPATDLPQGQNVSGPIAVDVPLGKGITPLTCSIATCPAAGRRPRPTDALDEAGRWGDHVCGIRSSCPAAHSSLWCGGAEMFCGPLHITKACQRCPICSSRRTQLGRGSTKGRSRTALPMLDAVVVGREAVLDTPQDGLGAA